MIIPTAATLTAAMTFGINLVVVAGFVAWEGIVPQPDWLLILPLLLELYLFTLGMALILTTIFVSLRDMLQVWELGLQLLFYASPIIYPIVLPSAVAEGLRVSLSVHAGDPGCAALVLYQRPAGITVTAADALGPSRARAVRSPSPIGVFALGWHSSRDVNPGSQSARDVLGVDGTQSKSIRVEDVPSATREADDVEGVLSAPAPSNAVRAAAGVTRRHFLGGERRVLRHHRPERQRQEHAAQDHRRHLPPGHAERCGSTASCPRSSSSASASTPSSRLATTSASTARCSASVGASSSERYDDIVAFSELERFVDQKLKNFSSGMQVRLAYAIAIQVDFDILLLDEVLAVGDESFQQKCFETFTRFREEGKTIVLVTHNLDLIERFADRALLLLDGHVHAVGSPRAVIGSYTRSLADPHVTSDAAVGAT